MATNTTGAREDMDILDAVHTLIAKYPPLNADRHHLHVAVEAGVVHVDGHVRTPIIRQYLVERAAGLPGVRGISVEALYDDETIRFEAGAKLPDGVLVNPSYGVVVLSGALPGDLSEVDAARHAATVPGVIKVVTHFGLP